MQKKKNDPYLYIRAKIDQLLTVLGTLPLRPEELDDNTLIELDPIGIVSDSFAQMIAHLNQTNHRLNLATSEIRAIFDTLGAAVLVLDTEGRIDDCNRHAIDWLFNGAGRADIFGQKANAMAGIASLPVDLTAIADGTSLVATLQGKDFQVVSSRILDEASQHAKTVILFTDITRQKENERHLELYEQVFSHVGEGILITDAHKRIIEINAAVTRITGYTREELIGSTPNIFKSGLHDTSFYKRMLDTLHQQGHWHGEIFDRARDGHIVPLLQTISAVRDKNGALTHYLSVMTDISSIKETQTRLDFLAHHDPLTELPNRLLFSTRLHHIVDQARRDSSAIALLFIDLDHFKNINDSLGHQIGDHLLIAASRRLRDLVRPADMLARLGGDEFVILMEERTSHAAATELANQVIAAFKQPFSVNGVDLHIRCSIGITVFPEDGGDAVTLLKNADAAMYRAKDAGRDGHVRYSEELSEAMHQKIELDRALRDAVRDSDFELYYQPIIDIQCGRVIACEALIRWPECPLGVCPPSCFIPLAEETRLIVPLGEWVLRQALARVRAWRAAGIELEYISVNISAIQLAQPDFPHRVIALLDESGVPGRQLQIELTENVLMQDLGLCARVLTQLREHGIRVAIDDFGTGYSSLSYLKRLPIDILKIDRSFVRDIPADLNDCAIAAAVIGLAKALGLGVVAEGIEVSAQQDYLVQLGCDQMQGYLYSKPLPADAFVEFAAGTTTPSAEDLATSQVLS